MANNYVDIKVQMWRRFHFDEDADMQKVANILRENQNVGDVIDDELGFWKVKTYMKLKRKCQSMIMVGVPLLRYLIKEKQYTTMNNKVEEVLNFILETDTYQGLFKSLYRFKFGVNPTPEEESYFEMRYSEETSSYEDSYEDSYGDYD